jgi:membrane peptidoglycan carboxypeptidase
VVRTLQVLGAATLLGIVLGAGGLAYAYNSTSIPEPRDLVTAQTTSVLWADGTPMGEFKAQDRRIVTSDQIPEHVKQAFVAAEDRSFYDNRGFSIVGIARAVLGQLTGDDAGGGSTITQQYVRNYYAGLDDRSWERKAREILLAAKIERRLDKDRILTDYLNTIYFGRESYGIQAASLTYFGVGVDQLTPAQAAVLAGILPAPVTLDPAVNPDGAQGRFEYVVDGMVETGALTGADAATLAFPEVQPPATGDANGGPEGFLLQMIRDELETKLGYSPEEIDTAGLTVTTTFSPVEQQKARDAVYAGLAEALAPTGGQFPPGLRVGLASIDPATGEVRAVFAGDRFIVDGTVQRSSVTFDKYQAGSTLKPFALIAGLEQGLTLGERYDGESPQTFGENPEIEIQNFGGESFGRIDLVDATADSVNTVYAQLNEDVGFESSYQAMVRAGLPPGCDTEDGAAVAPRCTQDLAPFELTNILGSAAPRVIDTAQAYATLAAQGVRRDWHVVREVRDADGQVAQVADTSGEPVFEAGVMADTTYALTQVVEEGSGRRNVGSDVDRPMAGKTGTASNNVGASFAGYTPQLATVVALYQEGVTAEGRPAALPVVLPGAESGVTGGSYPAAIFREYMLRAMEGLPIVEFPEPTGRQSEREREAVEEQQREAAEEERRREEEEERRRAEEERQRQEEERRRQEEQTPTPTTSSIPETTPTTTTTEPTTMPSVDPSGTPPTIRVRPDPTGP